MLVSTYLRQKNIAEYLLYMWQVEDLIRAHDFDVQRLEETLLSDKDLSEQDRKEWTDHLGELIDMMEREGVKTCGHLQMNKDLIVWLTDLHLHLLKDMRYPDYAAAYYRALPFIVELRAKGADKSKPEVETCFEALYGLYLLRLQHKPVSNETSRAQEAISQLLSLLAQYYRKDKAGELPAWDQ